MKYIIIICLTTLSLFSNPIDTTYSWIDQEYKDFRTYPRISKAQLLLERNETREAKALIKKSLKIDPHNKSAINLLLKICIQEKDTPCIEKYSNQVKGVGLGYFYKKKAEEAKEKENYTEAIKFSKEALKHTLLKDDKHFINLILFESYLKLSHYTQADKLINRDKTSMYQIFKWSKISSNMNETDYAYNLAKELPPKLDYIKWKIKLLLKSKSYVEASKQLKKLNKIEPNEENKKQLLHLYSLTGQDQEIIKNYEKTLRRGCDKYSLEFLLDYYKNNKSKKNILLEKNYPYSCLKEKQKMELSLELVQYLKKKNPKKAKKIATLLSKKITNEKDLINLYQNIGQKSKLVKIYQRKLNRSCNKQALFFLLDYYKDNRQRRKKLLERAYPYHCLSANKQTKLSLELISLLGKKDSNRKKMILKKLNSNALNKDDFLYLSNLESSLGNYNKAIEYATTYLKTHPNNIEAIKNIGYSYFKLNKKNSASYYLLKASRLDPEDYELLKNIGYICIDLKQYKTASYYWNLYLKKQTDSKIQLELASLYYYKLKQPAKAKNLLNAYQVSTKDYSSEYYILNAKLFFKDQNCKESLAYYEKALKIEKIKHVRYEQIHLLEQCKEESHALMLMEQFVKDYPNNIQYQKELAFMYSRDKKYQKAIDNYEKIKAKEPENVKNYITLANVYKKNHQTIKEIHLFKEAIDRSKNMGQKEKEDIKREITNSSKDFHLYSVQSLRLTPYKQKGAVSPINSMSYNGFGSLQLSYQPRFLPKNTTLYANIIHSHKKINESFQPSVGIRYKPLKDKKVYLSAEQLIKGGKKSRSDTLLRASLGISGEPKSTIHQNMYLESAYFAKADSTILYGNYELGKRYKVSKNVDVIPYITTGGSFNNDNNLKQSVTNLDAGVGVAIEMSSPETDYEIGKYKNTLKLEARQKYAGNTKDKQALRIQWEFFY